MEARLRILFLEDDLRDRELVAGALADEGLVCEFTYAKTQAEYEQALEQGEFDLVFSDFSLPSYDGMQALALARQLRPEAPFVLVSGTIGEERAVESLKSGATDCVLKEHLGRLAPAVRRALHERDLRRASQQAEEKLRASEERYRLLFNSSTDAVIVHAGIREDGLPGKFIEVNDIACQRLGYTREEMLEMSPADVDAPETIPALPAIMQRLAAPGQAVWEGVHLTKAGKRIPVEISDRLFEMNGKLLHLATARDITERKRAEVELRWKTAFLEAQVNSSLDGILVVDGEGKLILQNQRFAQLWKTPPDTANEADDKRRQQFAMSKVKDPQVFKEKVEYLYAHRDEVSRDELELIDGTVLDRYSSPVVGKDGTYYGRIWTFLDITEQRRLETQFRQAQKMEAIGQLAGGVAHDFNNMLAVIRGNAELLMMDGDQLGTEASQGLKLVIDASERAANLTRQLLMFSRKQVMQSQPLVLDDLIRNLIKMLQRVIREDIRLECVYQKESSFVEADAGMLEQVLLNLVVNARDAMPHGGQVRIATAKVTLHEEAVREKSEASAGEFVCLSVSDTGTGIASEHLFRIFDPFFTTKEPGKGTGLGLATVYGIVKQHHGWIEVSTELGKGTTFKVYLPAIPPSAMAAAAQTAAPMLHGGSETILLVEDDFSVRLVTRRMLESYGYKVCEASSGKEAQEVWGRQSGEIALLLSDIVMPEGMTGRDLAAQLRAQKPELQVIFMSGYSADVIGQDTEFFRRTKSRFLQKPCTTSALLQTVRQCLDEK